MSRPVLGGLVGRSNEWVKSVETGKLQTPKLPMLLEIAEALGLSDLAELTGNGHAVAVNVYAGTEHPALRQVQTALSVFRLPSPGNAQPVAHLAERLRDGWEVRHSHPDHRTALGDLLPDLIRDGQQAGRTPGPDRRAARAVLAGVYQLVDFFVAYQRDSSLVWLVADRALEQAHEADDPYLIACSAWGMVQALRDSGRWDEALSLIESGTSLLAPYVGRDETPDDWRGITGAATPPAPENVERRTEIRRTIDRGIPALRSARPADSAHRTRADPATRHRHQRRGPDRADDRRGQPRSRRLLRPRPPRTPPRLRARPAFSASARRWLRLEATIAITRFAQRCTTLACRWTRRSTGTTSPCVGPLPCRCLHHDHIRTRQLNAATNVTGGGAATTAVVLIVESRSSDAPQYRHRAASAEQWQVLSTRFFRESPIQTIVEPFRLRVGQPPASLPDAVAFGQVVADNGFCVIACDVPGQDTPSALSPAPGDENGCCRAHGVSRY